MQIQPAGPMTNQVTFEGYVVRAWTHGVDRFLRLANHRPANQGGPIPQSNMVYSDYTTVRLNRPLNSMQGIVGLACGLLCVGGSKDGISQKSLEKS